MGFAINIFNYIHVIYIVFFLYYFLEKQYKKYHKSSLDAQISLDKVFIDRINAVKTLGLCDKKLELILNYMVAYYNLNDIAILDSQSHDIKISYCDNIKNLEIDNFLDKYQFKKINNFNYFIYLVKTSNYIVIFSSYQDFKVHFNKIDYANVNSIITNIVIPIYQENNTSFRSF